MELIIGIIGAVIGVVTFGSMIIKVVVIKPLQVSIDSLKEQTAAMTEAISKLGDYLHDVDKRLAVVESSTKSAHKRIGEGNRC